MNIIIIIYTLCILYYIYIIYLIIYIVFFLTSVSKCACFKAFGRAAAFPYRLRKTQGVTVCAKGRGSPLDGGWPGLPLNREV